MSFKAKIKLCRCCGELFAPKKYGQRRSFCYKPECIELRKREINGAHIEQCKRWRKFPHRSYRQGRPRDKAKRKGYALCGHKSENHFNCKGCQAKFSAVYNEDWLYDVEEAIVYT